MSLAPALLFALATAATAGGAPATLEPFALPSATAPVVLVATHPDAPAASPPLPPMPPMPPIPPPSNRVAEATKTFATTGTAPVLNDPTVQTFPFGQSVPVVSCAPLAGCDIELQAGEVVNDVAPGDTKDWLVGRMTSGPGDLPTTHVVLKPTAYALETNLLITTDRRTYLLILTSPNAEQASVRANRRIAFYYPADLIEHWHTEAVRSRATAERRAAATAAELAPGDLTQVNFDYRISPADSPLAPLRVLDDGVRTYIQRSLRQTADDAPALLALTAEGAPVLLNYRASRDGRWYVVDGVLRRAQLVLGTGRRQTRVTIENLRATRP
jgi:P-type conjugative transfer protein TrbG